MKLFQSILVPLDGSERSAKSLPCATWLAAGLKTHLHILNATPEILHARDALERLKVPKESWPYVTLHQVPHSAADEILSAVEEYSIDLIVMTARGENPDESKLIGQVAERVVEKGSVPVLLVPPLYKRTLPWKSILVPLTGEAGPDESLTLALKLADALDLQVSVVHVADHEAGVTPMDSYSDHAHHEYPRMFNEYVRRGCGSCTAEQRERIVDVLLSRGNVADEVVRLAKRKKVGLVAAGWHGRLVKGRAKVLKQLMQALSCPLLLVKSRAAAKFKLKVGDELEIVPPESALPP